MHDDIAPAPAEAATDVGLDLEGDGHLWQPAPPSLGAHLLAMALALVAGAAGIALGPEFAAWAAQALGR